MGQQLWNTWHAYTRSTRACPAGIKPQFPELARIGTKWLDQAGRQQDIVDALVQMGGQHKAKFIWLGSDKTIQRIRSKLQDVKAMADTMAFGASVDATEAELMWVSMLDYAYAVLRSQTGQLRADTPAAIQVLSSGCGSIDPLVACVVSNFHPEVMRQHGPEAARLLVARPGIATYLRDNLRVNVQPLHFVKT